MTSDLSHSILTVRSANMEEVEQGKLRMLEEFQEEGVDTTFRETTAIKRGSVFECYSPQLFGDDDYELVKYELLKRVERETRAAPVYDVDFYMNREAISLAKTEELAKKFAESKYKHYYLRCKIAFKDLSLTTRQPILIRTRDGRSATLILRKSLLIDYIF